MGQQPRPTARLGGTPAPAAVAGDAGHLLPVTRPMPSALFHRQWPRLILLFEPCMFNYIGLGLSSSAIACRAQVLSVYGGPLGDCVGMVGAFSMPPWEGTEKKRTCLLRGDTCSLMQDCGFFVSALSWRSAWQIPSLSNRAGTWTQK